MLRFTILFREVIDIFFAVKMFQTAFAIAGETKADDIVKGIKHMAVEFVFSKWINHLTRI